MTKLCHILGSHSVVADDPGLPGCDAVLLSEYFPTYRKYIWPLPSRVEQSYK